LLFALSFCYSLLNPVSYQPEFTGSYGVMAAKAKRGKSRRTKRLAWRRWLLLIGFALLLSITLYTLYLDRIVQVRFEGQRWAIPAAVYGRPLALYPGARVTEEQLREMLDGLGYQASGPARQLFQLPGSHPATLASVSFSRYRP
jgi:hypothetical protein